MTDMELLIDLHRRQYRQGPGSEADTLRAIELTGLLGRRNLQVADIGCGTGASTFTLAEALQGDITAVDFLPEFLHRLQAQAEARGLGKRIHTLEAQMEHLPFEAEQLDLIWSEGAIYNMGFEEGLEAWRPLLKPGGILAVSEITWLLSERSEEIQSFWQQAYPQIDTAAGKFRALERQGYSPLALAAGFDDFLNRHPDSATARGLVAEHRDEQSLYEKYSEQYSYGFYVARKAS